MFAASACVAAALPSAAAASANGYVLGDSIGEGVADASGLKKLAHISVHIRGPKAIAQINATPVGSVAFIVLGTNDADGDGSIKGIEKSIDDVVRAGERRKLKMIWLGPPCVRRSFDVRSRQIDKILSDQLAHTQVKYISMRDERICSGVFHEPDGVHLTMKGYHYMWEKTERAVSWPQLASTDAGAQAAVPPARSDAGDQTSSVQDGAPNIAVPDVAETASAASGQMLVEVHRPSHALSSPIVWTKVSD